MMNSISFFFFLVLVLEDLVLEVLEDHSILSSSVLVFGTKTWISVLLNGLP